ncbi:MAG: DUF1499 domain-containing protein [Deltaproteobacteria bacterium]|nr:DUF1499 domain-containing protein [Deltaproteobacteria bacterium]
MKHFWYLLPLLGMFFLGCASGSSGSGAAGGRLAACPNSPNCVSSEAADARHKVEPFRFNKDAKEALDRLAEIISGMKGGKIVERRDDYIHAVFSSGVFKFKDDVEFLADPEKGIIHVRSAARMGYSDFGVNRKRVEKMRNMFEGR